MAVDTAQLRHTSELNARQSPDVDARRARQPLHQLRLPERLSS